MRNCVVFLVALVHAEGEDHLGVANFSLDGPSQDVPLLRHPVQLLLQLGESHARLEALSDSGNRVLMITDNAHLLALDRTTGRKLWDVTMGDTREGYSATAAPLAIGDLVVFGISGGEEGARGFVDAYRAAGGKRAWRFWTIPAPDEKGSETWVGDALKHGCGATWVTGSYDAALGLVYWTTGNPCPDFNGDERKGGSQNFIRAMDFHTGSRAWEYPLLSAGFGGSGTLATAGGLVFFSESGGTFTALDSKTGIPVRHLETGQDWRASPITYMAGGTRYVVLAGPGGIFGFALTQ